MSKQFARFRPAGDAIPGGVNSVEQVSLRDIAGESDKRVLGRAAPFGRTHSLAAVFIAAQAGNFAVRLTENRIVFTGIEFDAVRHGRRFLLLFRSEGESIEHQARSVPGLDVLQLFRKFCGVGGGKVSFLAENGRGLMLAVSIARCAGEAEHHDIGLIAADHPDHVGENGVVAPFLDGFFGGFREAEINGAREELFGSVDTPGT